MAFRAIQTNTTDPTSNFRPISNIIDQHNALKTPEPTDNRDFLQKAGDVVGSIFPGKQIGNAIGNSVSGITQSIKQGSLEPLYQAGAENNQNIGKIAGDVAQAGLTIAAPLVGGNPTALGRIGANAALGAGLGATGAIAQGKDLGDTAKSTLEGGLLGGGISAVGEGASKLVENLPKWLTKSALPKLDSKNIDYALENTKLGGIKTLATKSNASMSNYESQIQNALSHPQYLGVSEDTGQILDKAISAFPNSQYTTEDLIKNAHDIAPKASKLIQKMEAGQANLQELNTVRKELDQATKSVYTSLSRPPESKMLGAALANGIRDYVQTEAPETAPIFSNYAKEIGLNKALQAAVKKGETKVSFRDIAAAGAGYAHSGLSGALEAILLERGLSSPAGQIGAAKAVQAIGKSAPIIGAITKAVKAPLIKKATE